jgi:23S rRNA (cytosine1962-C5)-methyltransferase
MLASVQLLPHKTQSIERRHPWIFSGALKKMPEDVADGQVVAVLDSRGNELAKGHFNHGSIAVRVLTFENEAIDQAFFTKRITNAVALRKLLNLFRTDNSICRLIHGEGDELPGVVADYYAGVVVLKLDGTAAEAFWKKQDIANYFMEQNQIPVKCVYYKRKNKEEDKGSILAGEFENLNEVEFLENTVKFRTNIPDAAKTGFFLDQRENRQFIRTVSKDKTLLNLFGYTGGFSIYAGLGGATKVTTVDIAPNAITASELNWDINLLPSERHEAICEDAFLFVENAHTEKKLWDIVITDPPSFAPNQKAVDTAKDAYTKIYSDSLKLVKDGGFFAASSCSGHISFESFMEIVQDALSKSRRRGKVILVKGQPEDHPFPMALPEMRYLKFVYLQVFKD